MVHRGGSGRVAVVDAVAACEHAYALVRVHGEADWTARLVPFTVDGLICATSMVMLDPARRKMPVPAMARRLLGVGIAATQAATQAAALPVRLWPRGQRSRWSAPTNC